MAGSSSWVEIRGRVLDAIVPEPTEEEAVGDFARRVVEKLSVGLAEAGVQAVVEVHGSIARGTWLAGDRGTPNTHI
jgi:tRNA nucleotidyltransferase (CCA-adding enzyme)